MIQVTSPYLPPIEEFNYYTTKIWDNKWLTNNGPLVNDFELKFKDEFNLNHFLFVNNGTIALQLAIKALGLEGEVITTPFSFIATTSSIVWDNCKPIFVDINPNTFNIDPNKIEASITKKTSAILATHVFGNPCDIEAISEIASKHHLKVIYDAAHCFGVQYKGRSVLEFGDISTISFHATKLFHTTEGGGVFPKSAELTQKLASMRNFGFKTAESFDGVGINGKNSEFHAAMGLCNLKYVQEIRSKRKEQFLYYVEKLRNLNVSFQGIHEDTDYNYAYFPILFKSEQALLKAKSELELNWIYPRRYFYPSLSTLGYVDKQHTPVSDDISQRILCLPLYHQLTVEEQDYICRILLRAQNN
ncbi:DegT/DnrJ/EryC1/StrS family aminotransferase [Persicobacter psychrovividus]|uniref:Aminotransferase DegT n=1 Tax=Persicobacter psychrovividus TaxID=387638 RepID=A0ABM7VD63_9BACT|nr:aminotransferase DegT [Persicobacter psychrovividus]